MKKNFNTIVLLLSIALTGGCASLSAQKSAESLQQGQWESGVGSSFYAQLESPDEFLPVPIIEPFFRIGLTDNIDIEAKYNAGPIGNIKYTLPRHGKLLSAIELGAGYGEIAFFNTHSSFVDKYINYYLTTNFNHKRRFSVIPRIIFRRIEEEFGPTDNHVIAGVIINYQFLFDSGWSITPEMGFFSSAESFSRLRPGKNAIITPGLVFARRF